MSSEEKNEVNKDFLKCSQNENIMLIIYFINLFLMITMIFVTDEILNVVLNNGLIIINIIYIALNGYNDVVLKNRAENELRKTMIANAFDVNITTKKTKKYYSNNSKPSIERMGMNCFESTLYTKNITKKMIKSKLIKFIVLIIFGIILIPQIKNIELIVLLTQIIFSADVLLDLVKIIYYHIKVDTIYDNFYRIFVTTGYEEKNDPLIIEFVMEYECLKSYCHIILPNSIFKQQCKEIQKTWNRILNEKNKQINNVK